MVLDRNPKFAGDQTFTAGAKRATDLLWEATKGNVSQMPQSYLENLRYDFSDGKVSMLELIDRVDLGPDATYEDYCEVVDALMQVDPNKWPEPSSVLSVPTGALLHEVEPEFDFSEDEFDFAEEEMGSEGDPMSAKMEKFLKKVIASTYLDGVTEVTDKEGNPPTASNNYLLSEDGSRFEGIFFDDDKKFPFSISEKAEGKWQIEY